ncbi:MAG: DUF4358 domain-containing protein [Eubacterium sp.]|jgi:hypothetical protein|nr:DUF4358 domain-containing protein [Eubacterium sp.]
MKKSFILAAVSAFILTLAACGSDAEQADKNETNVSNIPVETLETDTSGGEEILDTLTDTATASSTEVEEGSAIPGVSTAVELSEADGTEEDITAQKIYENIKAAYSEDSAGGRGFLATMPIPDDRVAEYGLTSDMYEECIANMAAISVHADVVIIVKAKPDKVDEVEKTLEATRQNFINDTLQYPMNIEKVQATTVTREGDFFALIMLGMPDERENATESEKMEFAKEQNDIGVNAFLASFK